MSTTPNESQLFARLLIYFYAKEGMIIAKKKLPGSGASVGSTGSGGSQIANKKAKPQSFQERCVDSRMAIQCQFEDLTLSFLSSKSREFGRKLVRLKFSRNLASFSFSKSKSD